MAQTDGKPRTGCRRTHQAGFHVYAHCQRGTPGGVAILVINADTSASRTLMLGSASERYTLDAADVADGSVRLNGGKLHLGANDDFPRMAGEQLAAGALTFAPYTITFLAIPAAANSGCQNQ